MTTEGPVLVGVEGVVDGEAFPLKYGNATLVGRSRSCDVSLRHCPRWIEAKQQGTESDKIASTVSRKHLKITYHDPTSIELEDLSSNGTFVDGRRIDRLVLTDIRDTPHEIMLGEKVKFRLEWNIE